VVEFTAERESPLAPMLPKKKKTHTNAIAMQYILKSAASSADKRIKVRADIHRTLQKTSYFVGGIVGNGDVMTEAWLEIRDHNNNMIPLLNSKMSIKELQRSTNIVMNGIP
jgi:hypothetical protein